MNIMESWKHSENIQNMDIFWGSGYPEIICNSASASE